jgi:predicted nucleic acid-binding protein
VLYLDTSALLKLYLKERGSAETQLLVAGQRHPLPVWEIQQMEFVNALRSKVFWKDLSPAEADRQIDLFKARRRRGLYYHPEIDRLELAETFERLSRETMHNGGRTFDVLHVACALVLGARQFVTFDTKQSLVARGAGLEVPELSPSKAQP